MKTWKNLLNIFQSSLITGAFFLYRWTIGLVFYTLGVRCRFEPSCSHYGEEAIRKFGIIKGGVMTICRLCCCHPLHLGGHDPVPEQFSFSLRRKSSNG